MSINTNVFNSEFGAPSHRARLRLWNPNPKDESENSLQAPQVVNDEPPSDEIYLPDDRQQVNINNSIRHEDLPQCRPFSECHDVHPADPIVYDMENHGQNYRHKVFHDKWTGQEIKVFNNKYVNLQSNREKKFDLMAKALVDKTSADCRQFYYLYKHILDFTKPERERKQLEKERRESLLRLKEPCVTRLRSQESRVTPCADATPSKKYEIVKCKQTSRPVFVRNSAKIDVQSAEPARELTGKLQITEDNLSVLPASLPFAATSQKNNLSNLDLLAEVCSNRPMLQFKYIQQTLDVKTMSADPKKEKGRKRSHSEPNLAENTLSEKDSRQITKQRCLDNEQITKQRRLDNEQITKQRRLDNEQITKQRRLDNKQITKQRRLDNEQITKQRCLDNEQITKQRRLDNEPTLETLQIAKGNEKKRQRQDNHGNHDDVMVEKKKTRLGRAIKRPSKMDL